MEAVYVEIEKLEKELGEVENFFEKLEIKDKITALKREAGLLKPPEQDIECFGCGS